MRCGQFSFGDLVLILGPNLHAYCHQRRYYWNCERSPHSARCIQTRRSGICERFQSVYAKKKRLKIGLNGVCVAKSRIAMWHKARRSSKAPTFADGCEVVFRAGRTKVHSDHVNATSASSSKDWSAGDLSDRPWTNNFSTFSMSTLALTTTNICTECEG